MRRVLLALFTAVLPVVAASTASAQNATSAQKGGEIQGVIETCVEGGQAGALVSIPGRSFMAKTDSAGGFTLHYVPAGSYTLSVEIPGKPLFQIPQVEVASRNVTSLGVVLICRDSDGDGFSENVDCNDNNAAVNPAATESCGDGVDNNCDGQVDEGCQTCTDSDADGFFAQLGCETALDCDDEDQTIRPNADEVCDGVDNDCDGQVDENFNLSSDEANCGFCGNVCSQGSSCSAGQCVCADFDSDGWCPPQDCDDFNATVSPAALEVCDGIDNNCDGQVDEGCNLCPEGASCDDGDACTSNDTCSGGGCFGLPVICDDGNSCTLDTCSPSTGCFHLPVAGMTCAGGGICNESGLCVQP